MGDKIDDIQGLVTELKESISRRRQLDDALAGYDRRVRQDGIVKEIVESLISNLHEGTTESFVRAKQIVNGLLDTLIEDSMQSGR